MSIKEIAAAYRQSTEAFEKLAGDAAKKEALYKSNWAKEYLSAKGSIKEREAWAEYKLADEHFDYVVLGGGVSGLGFAKRVTDHGKSVLVLEKEAITLKLDMEDDIVKACLVARDGAVLRA